MATSNEIFLIGYPYGQIIGAKLPSNKQVLCVFFYNIRIVKLSIRESAALTVDELSIFWRKSRIPIRDKQHCIAKVEKLYNEWRNLNKHAKIRTDTQIQKETEFLKMIENLFDIAHANALTNMPMQEDVEFLLMQRQEGRPGYMVGADLTLAVKERKRIAKKQEEEMRKRKYYERNEPGFPTQSFTSSSESEIENEPCEKRVAVQEDEVEPTPSTSSATLKRGRLNFINQRLVAALDKCKVSDRNAVHIIIAVAEALGHAIDDLVINRTSIQRCRNLNRLETASHLKENFQVSSGITVHWDGKILPDITGNEKVDRLPVIVSQNRVEQLLGVPKISSGTGENIASAVFQLLTEWNLQDNVQAMCFDTTSTNTGINNGACTILEQKLRRNLLYLPCRHHIAELILKAVFELKICHSTSGPTIPLFVRFQKEWPKLNKDEYRAGNEDESIATLLENDKSDIINFCLDEYKKPICRDDYRELLQLTLIFLGKDMPKNIRSPGPVHHARWMAKALYCLKMFLFRDQFQLHKQEEKGLKDMCIFIVKFYVKYWFRCSTAAEAPQNDLKFLKDICGYTEIDKELSQAVIQKFSGHLWYLSSEAVALSFFDKNISFEMKMKMVKRLQIIDNEIQISKRLHDKPPAIFETYKSMDLSNFITANIKLFFRRFNIQTEFLECEPSSWASHKHYQKGFEIVENLRVVNDTAERGVKLFDEYNKILTHREVEKQYLLQVVTDYRKKYPSHQKSTLKSLEHE